MARPRNRFTHLPPRLTGAHALPTRDADDRPLLRLQTLGAATILIGESRLSASAGTQFALLLRVASAPGMLVNRDILLSALWPNQPIARQRANLRQSLYKLRSNDVRIEMQGDIVLLDASQVVRTFSTDRTLEFFERDFTHGVEPFGVFLPGFEVPWPELQEWVVEYRESVHAEVRRVLVTQLKRRRERADWGGADVLARWLLQFDPLNEEATLTIAECTALTGSKTEALAIIDRYLEELGPDAGDLRLQANTVRRRISDMGSRTRARISPTERYFVGREREMAELTMSMRRARWHDGSAVLVHGPAGIGKSRLARELEKVAAIEGFAVVRTSCRETELTRPMSIFLDLLPEIVASPGALGCAPESLESLKRLLPKDFLQRLREDVAPAADVATAENESALHERLENDAVAPDTADVNTPPSSLRRAILDVICAVADERPLLMIIEDVHWIDEQSWDALTDLLDRIDAMRVFVVLNSRERHARPTPPERSPLRLRPMPLASLSVEKSQELSMMVAEDLAASLTSDLGEWFARASEGVPLFVHSLVVHWVDTGEAGGVPPTLQGVIEQRLARLDGNAIRLLQTAVLLGKLATAERIQRILELSTNELLGALAQLDAIETIVASDHQHLRPHDLIAHSAVSRLTDASRKALHRAIGRSLFSECQANVDASLCEPALGHIHSSGDEQLLVECAIGLRGLLAALPVPEAALSILARLLSTKMSSDARSSLERTVVRLRIASGEYSTAFSAPLSQLSIPRIGDLRSDIDAEAAISLCDAAIRSDTLADRDRLSDLLVALVEAEKFGRLVRGRAADCALMAFSNDADFERAGRVYSALRISDRELETSASARGTAILFHTIFGDRHIALNVAKVMLQTAREAAPSQDSYQSAMRASFALRIVSEDAAHIEGFSLAFSHAIAAKMPRNATNVAIHLVHSLLELDELAEAKRWSRDVWRLFVDTSDPWWSSTVYAAMARVAIAENDDVAAEKFSKSMVGGSAKNASRRSLTFALAIRLHIELLRKTANIDNAMLESLLARRSVVAKTGSCDYVTSVCAIGLGACGDIAAARSLLRQYLDVERREVRPIGGILRSTFQRLG